jgi:RNA polymerase sigma factor (sigma-70 family)
VPEAGPAAARAEERALVERALGGDRAALEGVVRVVRDPVYRLALRMEWTPEDAEDATQEVLIRVVTRLASWDGRAALTTWAYRVAVNHLLNRRRSRPRERPTFDTMGPELDASAAHDAYDGPEAEVLAEEVRLRCTQAMLQCLDPEARLTYVLGDILRLPSREAAWVVGVGDAAYRKRLERARDAVRAFTAGRCGLLDPAAPCRCARRVTRTLADGRLDPRRLALARHRVTAPAPEVRDASVRLAELRSVGDLMRSHPSYAAPGAAATAVAALLRAGRYPFLPDPPAEPPAGDA